MSNKNKFKKTAIAIGFSTYFAVLPTQAATLVGPLHTDNDSTVVGSRATIADGITGIAISGASGTATVSGRRGIAIGGNSSVNGTGSVDSIAIGSGANIKDGTSIGSSNSIAFGTNASVQGQKSIAIGFNANAEGLEDAKSSNVAIGDNAKVNSKNSVAIGHFAETNNLNFDPAKGESQGSNLAIGDFAKATNNYGSAIGTNAVANGYAAMALSYNAQANSQNSVAIGEKATAGTITNDATVSYGEVAIGSKSIASGNRAMAIGINSKSEALNSVTIGENSTATTTASQSTAIGYNTLVEGEKSTAVGYGAKATGKNSIASGSTAKAEAENAIATGNNALANQTNAMAIGNLARAYKTGAVAIGDGAFGNGENSVTLGKDAKSYATNANTMGNNARTNGNAENGTAIGTNAFANGVNAISFGTNTQANANSIALGNTSKATGTTSIAIGENAVSAATETIAIGKNSNTLARYGVALGFNTTTGEASNSGYRSVAIGHESKATKNDAIALGQSVNSTNTAAIGIGRNINNSASGSIAIGDNVTVSANRAIGIGRNVEVTKEENIVLGSWSTETSATVTQAGVLPEISKATINDIEYSGFAGSKSIGVFSVGRDHTLDDPTIDGERRIINVGAGAITETSTDAINGSQLYSVLSTIKPVDTSWKIKTNAQPQVVQRNVTENDVNNGETVNFYSKDNSISITQSTDETNNHNIDLSIKTGLGLTRNQTGHIQVANTTLSQNVEQMRFFTQRGQQSYFVKADDLARHLNDTGFQLTGEALDGGTFEDTTDGSPIERQVKNGSYFSLRADKGIAIKQFYDATHRGYEIGVITGEITTENNKATALDEQKDYLSTVGNVLNAINSAGFVLKTSATTDGSRISGQDEVINPSDTVEMIAGKNLSVKQDEAGKITYATKDEVTFEKVISNIIEGKSIDIQGIVINQDGINANNKAITNVKDGQNDKDAVNVSQLNVVKNEVQDIKNNAFNAFDVAIDGQTDKKTINKEKNTLKFANGQGTTATLNTDDPTADAIVKFDVNKSTLSVTDGKVTGATSGDNFATATNVQNMINEAGFKVSANAETTSELINAGDHVKFIEGDNIKITRTGADFTIGTNKEVSFDNITLGNVVINKDNGINLGGKKITNLAVGVDDNDAVNMSQLKAIKQDIQNATGGSLNSFKVGINGTTDTKTINKDKNLINFGDGVGTTASINKDDLNADPVIKFDVNVGTLSVADGKVTGATTGNNFATATNVQNMINEAGFKLSVNAETGSELINAGDQVKFIEGENIKITRQGSDVTISTAKEVNFDSVNVKGVVINQDGINANNKKITNVADGVDNNDAVNVSQLNKAKTDIKNEIQNTINDTVSGSKDTYASSDKSVLIETNYNTTTKSTAVDLKVNTDGKTIVTNADGKIGAKTSDLTSNEKGVVSITGEENALTTAKTVKDAINNSGFSIKSEGDKLAGDQADSKFVKNGEEVVFKSGHNTLVKREGNTITYATSKNLDVEDIIVHNENNTDTLSIKADGVTFQKDGQANNDKNVTLNINGLNNGGNRITNIADGTALTDAVSVNQLQKEIAKVNASNSKEAVESTDGTILVKSEMKNGINTFDVSANIDKTTIVKNDQNQLSVKKGGLTVNDKGIVDSEVFTDGLVDADTVKEAINNSGFSIKSGGNKATGDQANSKLVKTGNEVTFAADKNLTVKREGNTITYATNSKVEFEEVIVKNTQSGNSVVNNGNSVTIVKAGNTDPSKNVILSENGLNNGGNRVTNVAEGVDDTDAVNVAQLRNTANAIMGNIGKGYEDLKRDVHKNKHENRAGIAGANAAAGLPQVYLPGKSMVAASAAHFKGENAIAVGYSRASDNGKLILKLQGNANTRGDYGTSVGLGYQW